MPINQELITRNLRRLDQMEKVLDLAQGKDEFEPLLRKYECLCDQTDALIGLVRKEKNSADNKR